jgi:chorismate dehydratase
VEISRIGAPDYLSIRPLIFGLTRYPEKDVELVYGESSLLAESLHRGDLDAALIPSIEFLRGKGAYCIHGPALIARRGSHGLVLLVNKPLPRVKRIAVDEFSRTPIAVLRIVLERLHGILPDVCVHKGALTDWRNHYDGLLLSDDRGLDLLSGIKRNGDTTHDLCEMWEALQRQPLVLSVWAYNEETLGARLKAVLTDSRDFGVENLHELCHGIARSSNHSPNFLYEYFTTGWGFHMGKLEEEGLKVLEDRALEYQLINSPRLNKPVAV